MSASLRFWSLLPPFMVVVPLALFAVGVHVPTPLIIFLLLFGLMLTGMPISISLGLTVLTYMFTMTQVPITAVALKLFTGIEKFEIMAIPFFILAGNFLTPGGVARRMINFATSRVGHWHGGLALAGVMACALFAAVSGSSPATVVAIGSIILPAMVKQGFPKSFGAGVITTSGALGILIPPSIVLIMAPILFPVAMKLGIDPVHFGIMMVVNMEVGMCHPPVGLNLYVASGITHMGSSRTSETWPVSAMCHTK